MNVKSTRLTSRGQTGDEEWYIPYNGPYEQPRGSQRRQQPRDSWGNLIAGEIDEDDTALASIELHKHYGTGNYPPIFSDDGFRHRPRDRAQSGASGRTTSSGVVDPGRTSTATRRRSTVSPSQRQLAASYISLSNTGGVGESPIPTSHTKRVFSKDGQRTSISGFFSTRGNRHFTGRGATNILKRFSRNSPAPTGLGYKVTPHRRSISSGSSGILLRGKAVFDGGTDSRGGNYSYNVTSRPPPRGFNNLLPSPISPATPYSPGPHPYAYAFPTSPANRGPHTAPLPFPHGHPEARNNPLGDGSSSESRNASGPGSPSHGKRPTAGVPFLKGIKQAISTPDLRLRPKSSFRSQDKDSKQTPKGKDRWLSAETWCDALLFPRPRLKVKYGADGKKVERKPSTRIVSPPGSPVGQDFASESSEQAVTSTVLAHSRSLADIGGRQAGPSRPRVSDERAFNGPVQGALRHQRRRTFSLDESALPPPAPSLSQVLEEKQLLDSERKQWQTQATHSFQNKTTRSMSRTRTKSLTQKGRQKDEPVPSTIDFLAARACLGNQVMTPTITSPGLSPAPSDKKLSKAKSHGHLRSDSWSRDAFKLPRLPSHRPIGSGDTSVTFGNLEHALKREGTRVIRLADPAVLSVKGPSDEVASDSQESVKSDTRIGIAVGTPPLKESSTVGPDIVRRPAHPYARGGMYAQYTHYGRTQLDKEKEREKDFEVVGDAGNSIVQDRLTPPMPFHPYAQQSSARNSYISSERVIPHLREDSDVPPPAKMWASWSPGAVREVLPREIKYSPMMPADEGEDELDGTILRNSAAIIDTVGVGEALAYAVKSKEGVESQLSLVGGGTEEHVVLGGSPDQLQRTFRQAVQYDATRPSYMSQTKQAEVEVVEGSSKAMMSLTSEPFPPRGLPLDLPRSLPSGLDEIVCGRESSSPDSPSPPHSPRPFDNPDTLDNFYDLFYKPATQRQPEQQDERFESEVGMSAYAISLPGSMRRRAGSGLSSLVRQLSASMEEVAAMEEGQDQHSRSTMTDSPGQRFARRQGTESTLEFVFEEPLAVDGEIVGGLSRRGRSNTLSMSPFHASPARIPEDVEVESSRASSIIEHGEDETERYRVGMVEPVLTPPVVVPEHRISYVGHMLSGGAQEDVGEELPPPLPQQQQQPLLESLEQQNQAFTPVSGRPRVVNSGATRTSAALTRSSYMTTSSSVSRISGLSEFPAPPILRSMMSPLTSYFNEAHSVSQMRALEDGNGLGLAEVLPQEQYTRERLDSTEEGVLDFDESLSSDATEPAHSFAH